MFDQQLDLDGRAHDLAPAHEQPKLFDSAPGIRGQIALETDCRTCSGSGWRIETLAPNLEDEVPCDCVAAPAHREIRFEIIDRFGRKVGEGTA